MAKRLLGILRQQLLELGLGQLVLAMYGPSLELVRIRAAGQQMLAALLDCPVPADAKRLMGLDHYERAPLWSAKAGASLTPRAGLMREQIGFVLEFFDERPKRSYSSIQNGDRSDMIIAAPA
ncbi:hypothetical protein IVA74_39520 [Bradyrhizobium sp. 132]|nr:hypothetical protein [Bradyrhizobium sp. 132]